MPTTDRARVERLGDFTLTPRVLLIAGLAIPVGAAGAGAAWLLLHLIALTSNLVFYGSTSTVLRAPGRSTTLRR